MTILSHGQEKVSQNQMTQLESMRIREEEDDNLLTHFMHEKEREEDVNK